MNSTIYARYISGDDTSDDIKPSYIELSGVEDTPQKERNKLLEYAESLITDEHNYDIVDISSESQEPLFRKSFLPKPFVYLPGLNLPRFSGGKKKR